MSLPAIPLAGNPQGLTPTKGTTMEVTATTVETMPDGAGTKGSKYDDILNPAVQRFAEGDENTSTRLAFGGATKADAQTFMRNLAHAANVRGHGIATVLKDEDGSPVGYFKIRAKRDVQSNGKPAGKPAKAAAKS